ncbi:MAG TPA: EF-hand domain-containing protein [Lacipirellulaceae bacterium]|jgi:hypothetical protein|nr:EF-hand domain-containing protein [Lacipirellulaceae bacterium]
MQLKPALRSMCAYALLAGLIPASVSFATQPNDAPPDPFPVIDQDHSELISPIVISTKVASGVQEDIEKVSGIFSAAKKRLSNLSTTLSVEPRTLGVGLLSKSQLFQKIAGVNVKENTTLFCYCKLHGEVDQNGEALLYLDGWEEPIKRTELEDHLKARGARLTILVTDSCSAAAIPQPKFFGAAAQTKFPLQLFLDLFVNSKGFVSTNSSSSTVDGQNVYERAWMDADGALFTRAFCGFFEERHPDAIKDLYEKIDKNHNSRFSWQEFFPVVAANTDDTFQVFRSTILSKGLTPAHAPALSVKADVQNQSHQTPRPFAALPDLP